MDKNFKGMTNCLVDLGIEKVDHSGKTYLAHLVGIYRFMEAQGCTEEVCGAGMFHSSYGTQCFQALTLDLAKRADVRALIGERAEWLAYLNCAMDRRSFDQALAEPRGPFPITDRITGRDVVLSSPDFDDLARSHLFDWLEQVPRCKEWDYRREAYRAMAKRLGEPPLEWYGKVFAEEGK